MATWGNFADVLAASSPKELAQIIPCYVEEVRLDLPPSDSCVVHYTLRLQPEVQEYVGTGGGHTLDCREAADWSWPARGAALTAAPTVCFMNERAPPPGLEPGTRGLTVRCSTD